MHDYKLGEFWPCMVRALDTPAPTVSDEDGTRTPTSAR